jgi:hypothetical protein
MDDLILLASNLRERAANCRDMAGIVASTGIAEELCAVAEDYEGDAERLERESAGSAKSPRSRKLRRGSSRR